MASWPAETAGERRQNGRRSYARISYFLETSYLKTKVIVAQAFLAIAETISTSFELNLKTLQALILDKVN